MEKQLRSQPGIRWELVIVWTFMVTMSVLFWYWVALEVGPVVRAVLADCFAT